MRAALLLAGVTWSLAMFAEWTTVAPEGGSAVLWFQWIFQHQLIATVAVLVALSPRAVGHFLSRTAHRPVGITLRAAVLVAGLSLTLWVPPPIAAGGAGGFLNELFGVWGLPVAWGAVSPVFAPGLALFARWAFQYLLLGGFAVALALVPTATMDPILSSLDGGRGAAPPVPVNPSAPAARARSPAPRSSQVPNPEASGAVRGVPDP